MFVFHVKYWMLKLVLVSLSLDQDGRALSNNIIYIIIVIACIDMYIKLYYPEIKITFIIHNNI